MNQRKHESLEVTKGELHAGIVIGSREGGRCQVQLPHSTHTVEFSEKQAEWTVKRVREAVRAGEYDFDTTIPRLLDEYAKG